MIGAAATTRRPEGARRARSVSTAAVYLLLDSWPEGRPADSSGPGSARSGNDAQIDGIVMTSPHEEMQGPRDASRKTDDVTGATRSRERKISSRNPPGDHDRCLAAFGNGEDLEALKPSGCLPSVRGRGKIPAGSPRIICDGQLHVKRGWLKVKSLPPRHLGGRAGCRS